MVFAVSSAASPSALCLALIRRRQLGTMMSMLAATGPVDTQMAPVAWIVVVFAEVSLDRQQLQQHELPEKTS